MGREEQLKDLYNFYKGISAREVLSFEHYKKMNNKLSDKEIQDLWNTMKKLEKLASTQENKKN